MPYKTPIGPTYDCGDFPKIFARALALADYDGFAQRRAEAGRRGRLRGIGIACYVESSGVAPSRFAGANGARVGFYEAASIRVEPDGAVRAMLGTHNHGQGHATTYAQILASKLGVAVENVEVSEGDTDAVPHGTGTFGSRSIAVGGCALDRAGDKIVTKGKLIAGHLLEAAATDVDFADGSFVVAGTDRRVSFAEVARAAYVPHNFPLETLEPGLQETAVYDPPSFAFSNGAHVCELEIDPQTGRIEIVGFWGVDDVGTVINPMIVEGQIHGGLALGLGQALFERCAYDGGGQLLVRIVHGLRGGARRRPAAVRHRVRREPALHPQSARRQGLRRGRLDRRARRGRERRPRRARRPRRHRSRHAADAGAGVAADRRGAGEIFVIPGRCQGNDVGYHLAKRCGCRCYSRRAAACCEARRLRRLGEQ